MRKKLQGFTLIEVALAAAMLSFIALLGAHFMVGSMKSARQAEALLFNALDKTVADRVLWNDFKKSLPSYNNIKTLDDQGNTFFDYLHDSNCDPKAITCSRAIVLNKEETDPIKRQFILMRAAPDISSGQAYQIQKAYKVEGEGLKYDGINPAHYFDGLFDGAFTHRNQMVMFYTFADQRDVDEMMAIPGRPMLSFMPRGLIYVGAYKLSDSSLNMVSLNGLIRTTAPWKSSVALNEIPNENGENGIDKFFRLVPPINGSAPMAYVRPVVFVKYYLHTDGKFYRSTSEDENTWASITQTGQFLPFEKDKNAHLIGNSVAEVIFKRESITLPTIKSKLIFN